MRIEIDSKTRDYILAHGGQVTVDAPKPAVG